MLGHESPAWSRPYLHADLELEQRALDRTAPPPDGRYTPSAKLVTVTVGSNDIGFASVLTYCLLHALTRLSAAASTCESNYNTNNSSNLYTTIDNLEPKLVDAYEAMKSAAPDAKIVAVTYPLLFQPGAACLGLTVPDVNFLNNVGEYLDNTIISASQAAGINVMDERYAFLGHQLCSSSDDPWVYSPPSPFPSGDEVTDTSSWFHPNAEGQGQMATDLAAYWSALQSGTAAPTIWPQSVNPNPPTGWLSPNLPYGIPTTAQANAMLAALPQINGYNTTTYSSSSFTWPATRTAVTRAIGCCRPRP